MNLATCHSPNPRPIRFWLVSGAAGVLVATGLFLLFRFNPAEHQLFPRCVFHAVSGWDCPGCGGQRALHQLLHGNLATALQHNALLVVLLPVALWFLAQFLWNRYSGRRKIAPFKHHTWPWVLCSAVIIFGVLRNLPGFGWLRP